MHTILRRLAVAVAALSVHGTLYAQLVISPAPATAPTFVGGKWQVVFGTSDSGNYSINGGSGTDTIEYIRVSGNNTIILAIGQNQTLENIEEIRRVGGSGQLNIHSMRLLGDLGPPSPTSTQVIQANNFNSLLDIDGSVNSTVETVGPSNSVFAGIDTRGDLRGSIINDYGSIDSIIVGGSIIGTETDPVIIRCLEDTLGFINLTLEVGDSDPGTDNGDIIHARIGQMTGTPSMVVAKAQIERDLIADVRLKAVGDPQFGAPDLATWTRFEVGRDYYGTFNLSDGLVFTEHSGDTPLTASDLVNHLTIGRTLKAGSNILVPAYNSGTGRAGLQSQVVINRNNHEGLHWLGSVTVGSDTLDHSTTDDALHGQYAEQPDDLGGGSIGVVPYKINGTSNRTTLLFRPQTNLPSFDHPGLSDPNTYLCREHEIDGVAWRPYFSNAELFLFHVEFYGLISVYEGEAPPFGEYTKATPFRIFRRLANSTSEAAWKDYTPCMEPSYSIDGRVAQFSNFPGPASAPTRPFKFQNGYEYKLEPDQRLTVDLGCNNILRDNILLRSVTGVQPHPVVASDRIIIRVGTSCAADLNGDGQINTLDLSILLNTFGGAGACPPDLRVPYSCQCVSCPTPGDMNGDDVVNSADLSVLLFLFGSQCPSMEPLGFNQSFSLLSPSLSVTGEQILAYLNFATIEEYSAWAENLNPEALEAHIADLLSIIADLEQSEQ